MVLVTAEGAEVSPIVSVLGILGAVPGSPDVVFDADFLSIWRSDSTIVEFGPGALTIMELGLVSGMVEECV